MHFISYDHLLLHECYIVWQYTKRNFSTCPEKCTKLWIRIKLILSWLWWTRCRDILRRIGLFVHHMTGQHARTSRWRRRRTVCSSWCSSACFCTQTLPVWRTWCAPTWWSPSRCGRSRRNTTRRGTRTGTDTPAPTTATDLQRVENWNDWFLLIKATVTAYNAFMRDV